jgi:hypothetical protein
MKDPGLFELRESIEEYFDVGAIYRRLTFRYV